jgi:hypothetical protein
MLTTGTPVTIAVGAVPLRPGVAFAPTQLSCSFSYADISRAVVDPGPDTLLPSASPPPEPDIVAPAATHKNDGTGSPARGAFAGAMDNLGADSTVMATASAGSTAVPIARCRTDLASGQCISGVGASAATTADATPISAVFVAATFAVFVAATGPISFDPAGSRITVQFANSGDTMRGATSVAVETQ